MTMPKPAPRKGAVIELDQEDFNSDVIIHKNLTQDVLVTTEDKMKLTLIEYKEVLSSRSEWLGAATLAFSFLSTLLLTDPKDTGPIKGSTWQAVYLIFFVLALARFINILVKMFRNRNRASVDYVIKRIKQNKSDAE